MVVSVGLAPVAISVRVEEDPELASLGRRSVGCEMRESCEIMHFLLVSVGLVPVGTSVHVQKDVDASFTRQPIAWRRDSRIHKI